MATTPDLLEPLVGTTVAGRYEIRALLGRGGMGGVYRAHDRKTDTLVALKLLPAERAAAPEHAARFQREATTGKRITHPNVVTVFDKGELPDGSLYLTMELLEGRSLADELDAGPMPYPRAIRLTDQILHGLQAAHELGIAHRDVKPDNVVLVQRDGREIAKVVDFGIASNERAAFKLTAAGVAFGTPEYLSPEMSMGLAVDARADQYAVGVMLYQLVTGRLPFSHRDHKQLLAAHAYEAPPPPRKVAPNARIPAALEAAILRALAKLPEERFPTARAMREALLTCLPQPQRRGSRVLLLALAAALSALAGWWLWQRSAVEPPSSAAPAKKHRR
jgi:serine/threonine-protein kinase